MISRKAISLFSGAGGFDIGFEAAGFTTLATIDFDKSACETLRLNKSMPTHGDSANELWFEQIKNNKWFEGIRDELYERLRSGSGEKRFLQNAVIIDRDIRTITSDEIADVAKIRKGELEAIFGGPPCQSFSRVGNRKSVQDERGRLFTEFVRIVDDLRPRWFVFENVKGLVLTKTDVSWKICKKCCFRETVHFSSTTSWFKESHDHGPCTRCGGIDFTFELDRAKSGGSLDIIIGEFSRIGYQCNHTILNAADFGVPQIRERLFIVGSRDSEKFDWPQPIFRRYASSGDCQLKLFSSSDPDIPTWKNMIDTLWPLGHPRYGRLDLNKAVLWVKNVVRPHAEPVTWDLNRPSPTVGAHQAAKLAIAPYGVPLEQLWRQQWHTRGRRQADTSPVSVEHSYLTDLELLKLQTFPTYWHLHGTRMQRAFLIGNAVPPVLGTAIGLAITEKKGLLKPMHRMAS